MHEFDQVPSLLGKPMEPVGKSTSVLQKIERVTGSSVKKRSALDLKEGKGA